MAKRPRNLWKRPNGSFRLGQGKPVVENRDEQRLTIYLPAHVLDWAEEQAMRAGDPTVQVYTTRILREAIEDARNREQVAEAETRRGALEGFNAITEDPEYLAEWSASVAPLPEKAEIHVIEAPARQAGTMFQGQSPSVQTVLRHAGVGLDDPSGFLATLRRGEGVSEACVEDLLEAIGSLEVKYQEAKIIDRQVAFALHRLAFEGQILHTDAWPGQFDQETVSRIRAVQEAVDRVLSGEDIRYYPPGT